MIGKSEYVRDARVVLLAGVVAALALLPASNVGIGLADEGVWVSGAWLLRRGERPYVDWYFTHPSVQPWILAQLFDWFGEDLLVARRWWLGLRALAVGLAAAAGLRLLPRRPFLALLPAAGLLLAGGPWHKAHFGLGQALTLFAMAVLLRRPSVRAGLLLGLAQGAVLVLDVANNAWATAPVVLFLLLEITRSGGDRRALIRCATAWTAGCLLAAAPSLPLFAPLLGWRLPVGPGADVPFDFTWALQASWDGFPEAVSVLARGGAPASAVLAGLLLDAVVVLACCAAFVIAREVGTALGHSDGGSGSSSGAALIAALMVLVTLPKILARADISHVLQAQLPFAMLALAGLDSLGTRLHGRFREVTVHGLAIAGAALFLGTVAIQPSTYGTGSPAAGLSADRVAAWPHARVRDRAERLDELEELVATIERTVPPDEALAVFPTAPMLIFLTERTTGSRFIWLPFPSGGIAPLDEAARWDLHSRRTPWVLLDTSPPIHGGGSFAEQAPRLSHLLATQYTEAVAVGRWTLLRRQSEGVP